MFLNFLGLQGSHLVASDVFEGGRQIVENDQHLPASKSVRPGAPLRYGTSTWNSALAMGLRRATERCGAEAWPLASRAQQSDKLIRLGFIGASLSSSGMAAQYQAFLTELHELGFSVGRNITVDYRRGGRPPVDRSRLPLN